MITSLKDTGERTVPVAFRSKEEYLLYLRFLFAYEYARKNIPKQSLVLDLGCGEGYGTHYLAKKNKGATKIIGLDVDPATVRHADAVYALKECSFRLYDGTAIPFTDNTFDAVISFQVVEHIKDDARYIREVWRVLKTRGVFICTTPNKVWRLKEGQKPWNKFHVREYYASELRELLKSKFSDVQVLGIRGNDVAQNIELKRIKEGLRLISYDPFNIRLFIPYFIKSRVRKFLLKGDVKDSSGEDFLTRFSMKDYYIIKEKPEDGLDILGFCRK